MKPRSAEELAALYEQYPGLEASMAAVAYADHHNHDYLPAWEREHSGNDHWYITYDAAGNKTYKERT